MPRTTEQRRRLSRSRRNTALLEALEARINLSAAVPSMGAPNVSSTPSTTVKYRISSFNNTNNTGSGIFGTDYANTAFSQAQIFFNTYKDDFHSPAPSPDPTPDPEPVPTPDPVPPPAPPPPPPVTTPVTVTQDPKGSLTRLTITGTSDNDSIVVSQSGNTITVAANGNTDTYTGTFAEIAIYGADGNDNITVQSNVTINTLVYTGAGTNTVVDHGTGKNYLVSIGAGTDNLTGNGTDTSFWADPTDTLHASSAETANGGIHRVSSFYQPFTTNPNSSNYIPLNLGGQNLADPTDTGNITHMNNSLWGTGPVMADINQGSVGDCYFLATIQSLALQQPGKLEEMAVDLGDGTYAVQFQRNGVNVDIRVDGDMPAGGWSGLAFAHPLNNGAMWAVVMEKAYALFRTGANTYGSLNSGWTGTVFSDLGVANTTYNTYYASTFSTLSTALAAGKAVTAASLYTVPAGIPIIGSHAYTVVSTSTVGGTQYVTVRNPWGEDGTGSDNNYWDGLVTITLTQFNAAFSSGSISV